MAVLFEQIKSLLNELVYFVFVLAIIFSAVLLSKTPTNWPPSPTEQIFQTYTVEQIKTFSLPTKRGFPEPLRIRGTCKDRKNLGLALGFEASKACLSRIHEARIAEREWGLVWAYFQYMAHNNPDRLMEFIRWHEPEIYRELIQRFPNLRGWSNNPRTDWGNWTIHPSVAEDASNPG